jgi:hypothetical protein
MPKRVSLTDALKMSLSGRYPPNETPNMPLGVKQRKRKRIESHSDEDDAAIAVARIHCDEVGLDFWKILHGIDAYMQRRRRRDAKRAVMNYVEEECDPW